MNATATRRINWAIKNTHQARRRKNPGRRHLHSTQGPRNPDLVFLETALTTAAGSFSSRALSADNESSFRAGLAANNALREITSALDKPGIESTLLNSRLFRSILGEALRLAKQTPNGEAWKFILMGHLDGLVGRPALTVGVDFSPELTAEVSADFFVDLMHAGFVVDPDQYQIPSVTQRAINSFGYQIREEYLIQANLGDWQSEARAMAALVQSWVDAISESYHDVRSKDRPKVPARTAANIGIRWYQSHKLARIAGIDLKNQSALWSQYSAQEAMYLKGWIKGVLAGVMAGWLIVDQDVSQLSRPIRYTFRNAPDLVAAGVLAGNPDLSIDVLHILLNEEESDLRTQMIGALRSSDMTEVMAYAAQYNRAA